MILNMESLCALIESTDYILQINLILCSFGSKNLKEK